MSCSIRFCKRVSKILICVFLSGGCYKNHLYVQQQKVDANFLASSYVHTPDPRADDPPLGQRLVIAWDFPLSLFKKNLTMVTTVRLWDQTEEVFILPLERKRDSTAYFFSNKDPSLEKKILTYRVEVFTSEGELLETWEHQFWTERIEF